jgi:hypothetical protein
MKRTTESVRELLSRVKSVTEQYEGFLAVWRKHESAPRSTCPECQFESSEGYDPSHASGCSYA